MKQILVITTLFMMALSMPLNAQEKPSNEEGKLYQYCTVQYDGGNLTVIIDYGFKEKEKVVDSSGKRLRFNSRTAILNYMTLQGWEYYSCSDALGGYFIFRRMVTQEQANQLIEKMKKSKEE